MFNFTKKNKRKKVGLVLGSGGFRGSAHIAVIKTLIENNIPIDFITGSSIGAIVASHYAIFKDIEKIEKDLFKQQDQKYYYLRDLNFNEGLLSGNTLIKDFKRMFQDANFNDTQIPLSVVATDLISGDPFIFNKGNIAEAVRASVSIPLTFKPFKFKDKILIDGGISNPVPDDVVKKMGADIVISINLYNKYNLNTKNLNLSKIINRATEITLFNTAKNNMKDSDIIINPDTSKYSDFPRLKVYFDKKISIDIMKIAQKETIKHISKIKNML